MRPTPMTPTRSVRAADPTGALSAAVLIGHQSSRSETTGSQRPLFTDCSSAAWTLTNRAASSHPGRQQRRLDANPLDGLLEARPVRAALGNRPAELVVLDDDEVLEADAVRAARHEVAVVREAVAAEHGPVAGLELVLDEVDLQLVELLEVPRERALRAVDLEGVLALGPDDRAARLERAARAVCELAQHPGVVLVRGLARGGSVPAAGVVGAGGAGQRALADERLGHPDHARDRPEQHVREIDRVAH